MVSDRAIDLAARALIELFGKDAPERAASMVEEKGQIGDAEGEAFWSRLELRIRERLLTADA